MWASRTSRGPCPLPTPLFRGTCTPPARPVGPAKTGVSGPVPTCGPARTGSPGDPDTRLLVKETQSVRGRPSCGSASGPRPSTRGVPRRNVTVRRLDLFPFRVLHSRVDRVGLHRFCPKFCGGVMGRSMRTTWKSVLRRVVCPVQVGKSGCDDLARHARVVESKDKVKYSNS